ncbi:MAG: hypothetical protein QXW00_03035 [Candidatus Woesearchaeota archaeon]
MKEQKEKILPEKKIKAGAITATIWKNRSEAGGNEFRTISLSRNYKDKDGNWQRTQTLRVSDLPKAQLVLAKAYEYLVMESPEESEDIEVENIE